MQLCNSPQFSRLLHDEALALDRLGGDLDWIVHCQTSTIWMMMIIAIIIIIVMIVGDRLVAYM